MGGGNCCGDSGAVAATAGLVDSEQRNRLGRGACKVWVPGAHAGSWTAAGRDVRALGFHDGGFCRAADLGADRHLQGERLGSADGEGGAKGFLDQAGEEIGLGGLHQLSVCCEVSVGCLCQRGIWVEFDDDDVCCWVSRWDGVGGHGVSGFAFCSYDPIMQCGFPFCKFNLQFVGLIAELEI